MMITTVVLCTARTDLADFLCIADPTWDRIAVALPNFSLEMIFKGIYDSQMGGKLQLVRPIEKRLLS